MTKEQAERLAKEEKHWVAKRVRGASQWGVWSNEFDHWVEFDGRENELDG